MALLHPYDVVYISFFWPGSIYSDAVAGFVKSVSESAIPARLARHLPYFEQPEFTALVLNVLHDDPKLMSYSGQTLIGAELGERYGIRDIDGKQPLSYRATMGESRVFITPTPDQRTVIFSTSSARPRCARWWPYLAWLNRRGIERAGRNSGLFISNRSVVQVEKNNINEESS